MNRFKKVGVAMVFASGMAFAQLLWTVDAPYGQVQFPWVVECTSKPDFDESNANDPCYKKEGGWWFGYLAGWEPTGEVGPKKCVGAAGMPPDGGSTSGVNKVYAKINGDWVNFAGADYPECEGPAITDKSNGVSLMSSDGLELRLTVGAGYILDPDYEPSLSGFGVNMGEYPTGAFKRDLENKNGFCLTYISDHENTRVGNVGAQMTLALGWDEGIKGNLVKGFDTWYAVIPPSNGAKVSKDFTWTGTPVMGVDPTVPNEAGMFIQDNWTNWPANQGKPAGAPFPITSATKEMTSVKISFSGYEAKTVNFKLMEFGFAGSCGKGGFGTPIAGGVHTNPMSFGMIGKVLSLNSYAGKTPVVVQIINLQGSIVKTQTMSKGDKMNLQNLPTGIYMVRVPAQGYVAKYAIK